MNYDVCVKSICNDYASELEDCKALKRHCQRKFLDTLIKETKEEYIVSDNFPMGTICLRVLQGNHGPKHCGTISPLNQAGEELVTICIQMGKIWQLLSVKEGIELMNSLMSGTYFEKMLQSFK